MSARAAVRSPLDLWRIARAAVALRALDGSLRRRGFAATHERARLAVQTGAAAGSAVSPAEADLLAKQVALAARVARVRCLPRAMLLYTWLGRAGAPVRLCIGVRRPTSGLRAHAWVEWLEPDGDSRPLGEPASVRDDFALLRGGLDQAGDELRASDFVDA